MHLNMHTGNNATKFYVELIKKKVSFQSSFIIFILILPGNNVHTCSFCGRFFAHKHVYESHVRTHTGKKLELGSSFSPSRLKEYATQNIKKINKS